MSAINNKEYIDELLLCIESLDPVKTRIILREFGNLDDEGKRRAVYELARVSDESAGHFFAALVGRTPALIEQIEPLSRVVTQKLSDHPDALIEALKNPDYKDKQFFIRLAGELLLDDATELLMNILQNDPKIMNQKAAMKVLGEMCVVEAVSDISDFLYAGNRELVICAVEALGAIGNTNAVSKLTERMGADTGVDILILNMLAKSQNNAALSKLNETLCSHHSYLRNYAKSKLAQIGEKAVPILLENLKHHDVDLVVHTLNVLGEIGDESSVLPIRRFLKNEPKNANVRFAAYEVLGRLPIKKGVMALVAGLSDTETHVAVCAAKAIEQNYVPMVGNGLSNLVSHDDRFAQRAAEVLITAEATRTFLAIYAKKAFSTHAMRFLKDQAPPDLRNIFADLLKKNGYQNDADQLTDTVPTAANDQPVVWAIDDSRMMLSIYKNMLYQAGLQYQLFEFPKSALTQLEMEKPDLILTDLNMPEISGLELTRQIRNRYNKTELPVVLITTQTSIAAESEQLRAGINEMMYKPFDIKDLQHKIDEYIR